MSTREKRLLIFFAAAGFIILNLLAFNFYTAKRQQVQSERQKARLELETIQFARESSQQILEDMQWLADHEPEPAPYQDVQAALQQLAERESLAAGLTIQGPSGQRLLPTDDSGTYFHSVKVQFTVVGMEQSLYRWIDRLNDPAQFRAVTSLRLGPNREDEAKIDCTAVIEQWFVPSSL
jgi:hypothetical protein